ncbi:hypothetical protein [Marinospirillum alkaliphilum]|uniref:Uncharacterized protein n=1 Tax=Marinospirillum alkaliphilum DSM 21637 TaxID=1122209 RepID=A0A1K1W5L4_9GAMM|nr:hypothetical protein [Marinospirillum alkaliphilum]SFX32666.1 hypothetical protein SAMN02745752_01298 [Marinospirillum alkaliphilum DSM 21637]
MNYQYKQQGGFILALALLMMLFVGVIVVSSIDRTGAEQRVATSTMHKPSLESAAEAGIYRARTRVSGNPDCQTGGMQGQCECNWNKLNDEEDLKDLLDLAGYGVVSAKMLYSSSNNQPEIRWWVDSQHPSSMSYCATNNRLSFVVSALQGLDTNVMSVFQMRTNVSFVPDPDSGFDDFYKNRGLMTVQPMQCDNQAQVCDKGNGNDCNSANSVDLPCSDIKPGNILSASEREMLKDHFDNQRSASYNISLTSNVSLNLPGSYSVAPGANKIVTLYVAGNSRLTINQSNTDYFYNIIVADGYSPQIVLGTNGQTNLFNGFIYAPSSNVSIENGKAAIASIVADRIHLNNAADLYLVDQNDVVPNEKVIADFAIDYSF